MSLGGRSWLVSAGALAMLGGIALGMGARRSSGPTATPTTLGIHLANLRPPAAFTNGMRQFLNTEEDAPPGRFPDSGSIVERHALWGYYSVLVEQEPWKSRLIQRQASLRRGWPPLPLEGEVLDAPEFQGRYLELYIEVTILPNQAWANFSLYGAQMSAEGSFNAPGTPCPYGTDCQMYVMQRSADGENGSLHRLWRWRVGRVVISVSALGAPAWPESTITPLLTHYDSVLRETPSVFDDPEIERTPPPIFRP